MYSIYQFRLKNLTSLYFYMLDLGNYKIEVNMDLGRGVEIAKIYTCPGTSKSTVKYLSIESFTCPIIKNR